MELVVALKTMGESGECVLFADLKMASFQCWGWGRYLLNYLFGKRGDRLNTLEPLVSSLPLRFSLELSSIGNPGFGNWKYYFMIWALYHGLLDAYGP